MSSTSSPLDPEDPRSVARWAAERVWADAEPRTLWVRRNLDGTGFMLTDPEAPPRGGVWTRVVTLDVDDAERIAQRGPRGWPALVRLAEAVEDALQ